MQKEYVARKRLASGRTPQQQRNLAISLRVLRKVVVKTHRMPLRITEIFADSASSERRNILHRSRLGSRRRHHDAVLHRAIVRQDLYDLRDGRTLLPNR